MASIPVRELRNDVSAILRRVEQGERFEVTVRGRPVAALGPLPSRPRTISTAILAAALNKVSADAGLANDLAEALGGHHRRSGMTVGLADTSIFIGYEAGRLSGADVPDDLAVSAVTVGELRLGVLLAQDVAARMRRLSTWELVSPLDAMEIDRSVAAAWAGLVAELRQAGCRMPRDASWIAATALAHDMPLVTQDSAFDDVPVLTVVRV